MISQQIEKERVIPSEKTSQNMPLLPHYSLNVPVSVCHSFSYSLSFVQLMRGVYWTRRLLISV